MTDTTVIHAQLMKLIDDYAHIACLCATPDWYDTDRRDEARALVEQAVAEIVIENEQVLAANLDCIMNFDALKEDYDKLLDAIGD
jgi:hypothetical protein